MPIVFLVLISFLSRLPILTAQTPIFNYTSCFPEEVKYTNSSTYQTNLNIVLSDLSSNTEIDYGFYNMSRGQNPDRVSAIGLCRGDIEPNKCRTCLKNASALAQDKCPNQMDAMGGYYECFVRYSNRSILGVLDEPEYWLYAWTGGNKPADPVKYNQEAKELLQELRVKAAAGDSLRKYAAANKSGPQSQTIYGTVQCTPDLSQRDCSECLSRAIAKISDPCCGEKVGVSILKLNCNIRFENYLFFEPAAQNSPPPPLLSPPATSTSEGNNFESRNIIVIIIPLIAVAVILLLISIFIFLIMKKPKEAIQSKSPTRNLFEDSFAEADQLDGEIKSTEIIQFDFDTIKLATNNFSDSNKLGQGGFGAVYKGEFYNGEGVAVKRLSKDSGQGDREFKNEVMLVAKLQHRNLVRLLGFCLERGERLVVYEFLPNKSLDFLLFDPDRRAHLNWAMRHKIIVGVTRGLLYLHEDSPLRVIHRDLKASNILLDGELNPKISDFGIARLFSVDQIQSNTSRIVGTYGYMAPEYIIHGQFSMKSDVYSFGVLILEIISGKKNNSIFNENIYGLVNFAWQNWRQGNVSNIIDPLLINNGSGNEIMRCIHVGLLCVQENVVDRPTMASVGVMLNSHSVTLPVPSKPPFLMNNTSSILKDSSSEATISSEGRRNYVQASRNEASITDLSPH